MRVLINPADHAMGLELELAELVGHYRRTEGLSEMQRQAIEGEIDSLHDELARAAALATAMNN
ncbi:MAG: hypothetical protein ACT4OS_05625 [Acidimicrobiales bacterium]